MYKRKYKKGERGFIYEQQKLQRHDFSDPVVGNYHRVTIRTGMRRAFFRGDRSIGSIFRIPPDVDYHFH